ncbi:MAG: iron chelate uptake ABC transporter family permease subunit [Verrucomicrobiota bacterium]
MPLRTQASRRLLLAGYAVLVLLVALINLTTGTVDISTGEVLSVIAGKLGLVGTSASPLAETIIWDLRLPRIVLTAAVGAAIAVAGAALQGLFRNPLADPSIIGVSSGAAVGGVLAILFTSVVVTSASWLIGYALPLAAITGGVAATFIIYRLSSINGRTHIATMLLTGIAVNAIAAALIGFAVTRFADVTQIRSITFWTLGSTAGVNWYGASLVMLGTLIGTSYLIRQARALNAFLLGESEAFQLGINVNTVKRNLIFVSAAMVGLTVALCGIIGFIGLVVPHIVRLCLGPDHRYLLPGSAILGGAMLLLADLGARTLVAPAELQIGILTALVGGPFFLGLLLSAKRKHSL